MNGNLNDRWLFYDIVAHSDLPNTYIENLSIEVQYDTTVFGGYVSDSLSSFQIDIFDSLEYDFQYTSAYNSFSLVVYEKLAVPCKRAMPTTDFRIASIGMKIKNSQDSSSIDLFYDNVFNTNFYWENECIRPEYFLPYTLNISNSHNPVILEHEPYIYSFSPDTITAGTGDTLTIIGKGFDYLLRDTLFYQLFGVTSLKFSNSENDYTLERYLNNIDYTDILVWNDTAITILFPSFIEDKKSIKAKSIGTGNFIISNTFDNTVTSNSEIHIKYGIRQELEGLRRKRNVHLSKLNLCQWIKIQT